MLAELDWWLLSQLAGAHSVCGLSGPADGLVYQLPWASCFSWTNQGAGGFARQRGKARDQGATTSVNFGSGIRQHFGSPALRRKTDRRAPSRAGSGRGIPSRSANPSNAHSDVPLGLVSAVRGLGCAIHPRQLALARAEGTGIDLGGQRDGSRGEDECGDQRLGKHVRLRWVLGRSRSDTKPLARITIRQKLGIERELAHAADRFLANGAIAVTAPEVRGAEISIAV